MISQISKALSSGFTSKQILDFLMKKFPEHSNKIKYALASGYTVDQVLKFLSGGRKALNEDFQSQTEYEKTRETDIQRRETANKQALSAIGLAAIPIASQGAAAALSRSVPRALQSLIPGIQNAIGPSDLNQSTQPSQQLPIPSQAEQKKTNLSQQPPVNATNIPQQQTQLQPEIKTIDIEPILTKFDLKQHVDKLKDKYKDPEQIAAILNTRFPKQMKALQRESGKPMEQAIGDYLSKTEDPRYYGRIEDLKEKKLFHQTSKTSRENIEKEGFKLGIGEKNDIELPSGVYLKPSDVKINLPGNEQIEVNAKLGKTAHFEDRKDYTKYLRMKSKEYNEIYERFLDKEKQYEEYLNYLDKNDDVEIDDVKLKKLEDEINHLAKKGRGVATKYFNENGINSLHIKRDSGGENIPGGATETYITLSAEQANPIKKNSIIASPNGMGEVKEMRNGQALIDIDGKLHKAKEEELIQSPLPEKDLAELYNDLIGGIEKESGQQVSRNVYWSGYDPKTNELAYVPHDGALYIYDDISPEDGKELTNLLSQRKSTGQNYIGAWTKGTQSPIGAAMYKLIQKLQSERGGKGKEYSGKFEKLYDALELAKHAAKKKHEEKRKAKKSRPD